MSRKAWFLWRQGSREPRRSVVFDSLPGPDGRAYGGRILATHELPPITVEAIESGAANLDDLAAIYPPPIEMEGAKP